MEAVPCPKCGRPVDLATRRCEFDGFEVDSSHALAVATTIEPGGEAPSRTRVPLPSLVGTKLGKYVVRELVGKGGMATVWRAVHDELGGEFAIKILDKDAVDGDEGHERFLREAKVSARLNHAHVVKVIDFARDPLVGSYIVMELLSGEALDRVLAKEGPLDEKRAIGIGLQIADALSAAHALGIVHRDVKPANVFVTRALGAELVKVMDFGIAKLSVEKAVTLTRPGRLFGTPLYMSPEQWDNAGIGPASDVYSLGVVLYEMVTGRPPITGSAVTEMAKNVALTEPKSIRAVRPEISPAYDALVLRCLRKEPSERFATMQEVAAALEAARLAPRAAPRSPSRATTIAVGVAAALSVGAAAITLGVRARSPRSASAPPAATSLGATDAPASPPSPAPPPSIAPETTSSAAPASPTTPGTARSRPLRRDGGARAPASASTREDDDLLRKK
jgi:serine/threonine-protein kinase